MRGTGRILVADDQPDVVKALQLLLKGAGFDTESAHSPAEVVVALGRSEFDAVLMDLNYARDTTSGREGLELLARILAADPTMPVIVMTAWGSIDGAVEAMRKGARDYIEKPWDNARLLSTLGTQVALRSALRRGDRLEGENQLLRRRAVAPLIAESTAMQPVLKLIERVAASDANVLITGEHGTGKEVVARALHSRSRRSARPLIAVNAGGIPEGLFESELFGHVKGAFTDAKSDRVGCFELADTGTLFLDEIANLGVPQQARLLRALESGEIQRVGSSRTRRVDVRVLSATNADIGARVREGTFREDLLYRLNTVEISLPPLRARGDDILLLARHFLDGLSADYGRSTVTFTPDAVRAIREHSWPGNVRELKHAIERALLMSAGDSIDAAALNLRRRDDQVPTSQDMTLAESERAQIRDALARFDGNVSQAARALGLSRSALYRRIQQHGL